MFLGGLKDLGTNNKDGGVDNILEPSYIIRTSYGYKNVWHTIIGFRNSQNAYQIAFQAGAGSAVAFRPAYREGYISNNSINWESGWKEINDTPYFYNNYASLDELITGMIALVGKGTGSTLSLNADDLTSGIKAVINPSIQNNFPSSAAGFMISFKANNDYILQLYLDSISLYKRGKWNNGNWGSWMKVDFSAL